MAETPPPTYRTLSWLRQGLPASGGTTAADGRIGLPARLAINGNPSVSVDFELAGPADVTGIDAREVIRTDPRPQTNDFEPNYFPSIEFDRPDFPWLLSPTQPDAHQHLYPWICLVVVRRDDASLASGTDHPLPILDCPLRELPDLAESWAWAHAELVTDGAAELDPVTLQQFLKKHPERTLSRLLCPRRLDPNTRYWACLVPAYQVGRLTGLGETVGADQEKALLPAWTYNPAAEERIELPVYFHWEFGTGVGDDFEGLARKLTPQPLPDTVGLRPLDVTDPGWGMPKLATGSPGAELDLGGALQTPETAPKPWPDAERKVFQEALRSILDTAVKPDSGGSEPAVLAPPLYGRNHAGLHTAPAADGQPRWLAELNLDPRHRVAAGMGAQVIRYEQEHLMAAAWDQLARHEADSQRLKRVQLVEAVGTGLRDKHVAPTAAVAGLPGAGFDQPSRATSAEPAASAAYRRLTRTRGPLAKRMERIAATAPLRTVAPQRALAAVAEPPAPLPDPPATELPRFAPEFPHPMYELLRDYFRDALLPGMDEIPNNAVALLKTNPAFVEAFLTGLNHEMSRELLWRGFPADPSGSYFRRFWDLRGAGGTVLDDIAPARDWGADSGLGTHGSGGTVGKLVLVIRGDLLRRYPNAAVYAVKAMWSNHRRELSSEERYPLFRATQPPDINLLGFDLIESEARGADDDSGEAGWFFVLQEQPTEPRFGLDVATASYGGQPQSWRALSWSHLAADAASLQRLTHVPAKGPLESLKLDDLVWGHNSAQMAAITRQRPFRVAIHARTWLAENSPRSTPT